MKCQESHFAKVAASWGLALKVEEWKLFSTGHSSASLGGNDLLIGYY